MELKEAVVHWETDFDAGLERVRDEGKPGLLFFYTDGCHGCAKMESITFPDLTVANLINERFVPIKVDIMDAGKLAHKYHAVWTPNFRILDIQASAIYRSVGWLPPSEFAPMLLLGLGHFHFDRKRYEQAAEIFALLPDRYPRSGYLPECRFYLAVSRYMASNDHDALGAEWEAFYSAYPDNLWALRTRID